MIESEYVYLRLDDVTNIIDGKKVFVFIEPEGVNSEFLQIKSQFLIVNYKVDQNKYEVVWNMK